MPISLRPDQGPDQGGVPRLGDPAFDALLARDLRPEEAVASLRPVVESFATLYAAPVTSGLAAEASALTAFRSLAVPGAGGIGRPGRASGHRAGQGRTSRWARSGLARSWLAGAWLAGGRLAGARAASARLAGGRLAGGRLAVAAGAIALTAGSAAAAYAGMLPAPVQRLAHAVIGAPLASRGGPRPEPGRTALSPLPGNSAYGLCQAYQRAAAQGHPEHDSVAFRRLAEAAGGASRVQAYCARLAHPGNPASAHPAHPPRGKPSALPTPHGNPTPASGHHGKPSALPTPAATHHGKPTGN